MVPLSPADIRAFGHPSRRESFTWADNTPLAIRSDRGEHYRNNENETQEMGGGISHATVGLMLFFSVDNIRRLKENLEGAAGFSSTLNVLEFEEDLWSQKNELRCAQRKRWYESFSISSITCSCARSKVVLSGSASFCSVFLLITLSRLSCNVTDTSVYVMSVEFYLQQKLLTVFRTFLPKVSIVYV